MNGDFVVAIDSLVANCTTHLAQQFCRQLERLYGNELAKIGLRMSQFFLLAKILDLGTVTNSRLAKSLGIELSTLSRTVKPLIRNQWILPSVGRDLRTRFVSITPEGRRKYEQAVLIWKALDEALNNEMGAGNVRKMHDCLRMGEEAVKQMLMRKVIFGCAGKQPSIDSDLIDRNSRCKTKKL